MAGLVPVIARHPEVPVIINHMGMPVLTDADGLTEWREGLRAGRLCRMWRSSCRGWALSGATGISAGAPLAQVVDLFGTQRAMIASDTPTDKLFAPLSRYLDIYRSFAAGFSEQEQRDLWGRNANRIYRLGLTL
jgi:predicted TIM-barrel fold metal-dependent hydrolase